MTFWRKLSLKLRILTRDEVFIETLESAESFVSKVLSIAMILVIFVSILDLAVYIIRDFLLPELSNPGDIEKFGANLFKFFGLVLNVLIAMEILENVSAYLRKNVVLLELVIVTSLIAVARKIIIFDFDKPNAPALLVALGISVLALSGSYWVVRRVGDCHKRGSGRIKQRDMEAFEKRDRDPQEMDS